MSIKDKLAALLRGQPSAKPPDKESAGTPAPEPEQAPESSGPGVLNQSLLELSAEHQIYRLYNQRRQEAGYRPDSAWTRTACSRRRWCTGSWAACGQC